MDRIAALRTFKGKLQEGRLLTGMACAICHPAIIEIAGRQGHDYVILDAEHAAMDRQTLELLIRAAEAHGLVSIVKLKRIDEIEIRDALDLGALGVMAPHIKTAEDVRQLLAYTYFAPRGHRGVCGAARANAFSAGDVRDLVRLTNEEILAIPVIEEGEAAKNMDAILAVDDRISIYDIGPVDMALSLGLDLDRSITNPSPELKKVLDEVLGKIRAKGKHVMYPTRFPNIDQTPQQHAATMRGNGVSLVYGFDTQCLVKGSKEMLALRAAGNER